MATGTKVDIEIDITHEMLAAGLQVLVDSGVLDEGAGRELPTGADEALVSDIYKAMARARSTDATIQVTLPGVIGPGAELVVKNESDQPIRVVTDPHETLKLKVRDRLPPRNAEERLICSLPLAARASLATSPSRLPYSDINPTSAPKN
jgi:hypothetical protein